MDNQTFKKLKAAWYKKLKAEGFDDIEVNEGDSLKYGQRSRINAAAHLANSIESKMEYYRLATHFLREYKFDSKLEQIIWEYHSNGLSVRDIVITLNKVRRKKLVRMTVWRIVERLRTAMKQQYKVK